MGISSAARTSVPRTFRSLLNHFGDAHAALGALPALARRGGGSAVPKICSREAAEREIEAGRKLGVALVAIGAADYPHPLQMIDDAPPLLAVRGSADVFAKPRVAIVGSRNSSAAGVKMAQQLALGLGNAGFATASPPERSPYSPEVKTAFIRPIIAICSTIS